MSIAPKICATNVFLALIDLEKPSRDVDVIDYLAGETGADSRQLAYPVRRQLDNLVCKGFIERHAGGTYSVVRDEHMVRDRLKILGAQDTEFLNKPFLKKKPKKVSKKKRYKRVLNAQKGAGEGNESCISITDCISIATIPREIRRNNPVLRCAMSQAEFEYTQRFWRERLSMKDDDECYEQNMKMAGYSFTQYDESHDGFSSESS